MIEMLPRLNEIILSLVQYCLTLFIGLMLVDVTVTIGAKIIAFTNSAFDHVLFFSKKRK